MDENDQWIRDLRWAISSPLLMDSELSVANGNPLNGERHINQDLVEILSDKYTGHRVGYYFESLIEYWLLHIRKVEILARGFQVLQEGRTKGELDFVFRDEEGRIIHWEVAAKFYLYYKAGKVKGSHYIGPNAQDTFELKREKIFGKQLPLSEMAFPEVSIRQAFVKGRIFYHPDSMDPKELPLGMRADHLRGTWLRFSELSWIENRGKDETTRYRLIEKPYWLAPERVEGDDSSLLSFRELKDSLKLHFSEKKHPVLFCILDQEETSWLERERVFMVDDRWPESQ